MDVLDKFCVQMGGRKVRVELKGDARSGGSEDVYEQFELDAVAAEFAGPAISYDCVTARPSSCSSSECSRWQISLHGKNGPRARTSPTHGHVTPAMVDDNDNPASKYSNEGAKRII